MRKIDPKIMANAIKEYVNEGATLRELSGKWGFSPETIRRHLGDKTRKRGEHWRNGGAKKRTRVPRESNHNQHHRWTPQDDELLRDAVHSGFTVKEVSEMIGRSPASIYTRKWLLIGEGFINRGERFIAPTGELRKKREMAIRARAESNRREREVPPAVLEKKAVRVVETESGEAIRTIRIQDLADLVNKHGVKVSISILKTGTEIRLDK